MDLSVQAAGEIGLRVKPISHAGWSLAKRAGADRLLPVRSCFLVIVFRAVYAWVSISSLNTGRLRWIMS